MTARPCTLREPGTDNSSCPAPVGEIIYYCFLFLLTCFVSSIYFFIFLLKDKVL